MTTLIARALYNLIPFFLSIALWCIPLIYLHRAVNRPFWLLTYMVLVALFTVGFSVWWVTG